MRSEAKWQEIDQLLASIADFSRSNLATDEFARQVLGQLLQAFPCAAAGFWEIDQNDQIRLTALLQREGETCSETLIDIRGDSLRSDSMEPRGCRSTISGDLGSNSSSPTRIQDLKAHRRTATDRGKQNRSAA